MLKSTQLRRRAAVENPNDRYETPPAVVAALVAAEKLNTVGLPHKIWEPAAGTGRLSRELQRLGYAVTSSDLYPHRRNERGIDFTDIKNKAPVNCGVITNPPYLKKLPLIFCARIITDPCIVYGALLVTTVWLGSRERYEFFKENPISRLYFLTPRIRFIKANNEPIDGQSMDNCWVVFDKRERRPKFTKAFFLSWKS